MALNGDRVSGSLAKGLLLLFITSLALLIAILVVTCLTYERIRPTESPDPPPIAHFLLSNIDEKVSPCQDFYQYACGGFIKKKRLQKLTDVSTFAKVTDAAEQQLIGNLNELEGKMRGSIPAVQTAINIYRSCKAGGFDTSFIIQQGRDHLLALGGWPILNSSWSHLPLGETTFTLMAKILRNHSVGTLLNPIVEMDLKHVDHNAMYFLKPRLQFSTNDGENRQLILGIACLLHPNVTDYTRLKQDINDMLELASNLNDKVEAAFVRRKNFDEVYNLFNLTALSSRWQSINFDEYMKTLYVTNSTRRLEDAHFVALSVETMDVINDFFAGCLNKCERTLVNYLLLCSLENWLSTYSFPQKGFSPEYCARYLTSTMPFVTGRIYVGDRYPSRKNMSARSLVNFVATGLKHRIQSVPWMDKDTRREALMKINSVVTNVAVPTWLMDDDRLNELHRNLIAAVDPQANFVTNYLTLLAFCQQCELYELLKLPDRHSFVFSPAVVNAWYVYRYNAATIPEALMRPFIFDVSLPVAVNFGALGSIVGHVLVSEFDTTGLHHTWNGTYQNWMTYRSRQGFTSMVGCVIRQYNKHCYDIKDEPKCVNGSLTLKNNIGSNGGIKAAYDGYRMYASIYGEEPPTPGLERYSMDQIFFLSFAQVWCAVQSEQSLVEELKDSLNSPADARVTESLRNFPTFGRAFNCKPNDPMMPTDRCTVW